MGAERIGERTVFCHACVDFLAVIEVVGQRRVHVAERQVIFRRDFVGTFAKPLVLLL